MPRGSSRVSDDSSIAARARRTIEQSGAQQRDATSSQSASTRPDHLLQLKGRGTSSSQADLLHQMQQTYGNRATQRYLQRQRSRNGTPKPPKPGKPASLPTTAQRETAGEQEVAEDSVTLTSAQRAASTQAPASPAATPTVPTTTQVADWLVEDSVETPQPGQMRKSAFLAQVRGAVKAGLEQAMPGAQAGAQVDDFVRAYGNRDIHGLEQEIRRTVPGARTAPDASAYVSLIAAHVRRTAARGPGEGGAGAQSGGIGASIMEGAKNLVGGIGKLLFKPTDGGSAKESASPASINAQLGHGEPLDGGVRGGLESAFGQSFSNVRVHTDAAASNLSGDLNARAFTVGQNIAFGPGEYRPGTAVGDALIAHEVAHVVQQNGASSTGVQTKADDDLSEMEEDADTSAVKAVVGMRAGPMGGLLGGLVQISREVMPRLRSGLRLQRCSRDKTEVNADVDKIAGLIGFPDENADEIIRLLGEGNKKDVADALTNNYNLSKKHRLSILAGTAGGRRILEAMRVVLERGDGTAMGVAIDIKDILAYYEEDLALAETPKPEQYQKELERLNSVLSPEGDYTKSEVDYPPGKTTKIVPLTFPITFKPGVPQMGGLYYNPGMDRTPGAGGVAGATIGESWSDAGAIQLPLIYIVLGPRALHEPGSGPIEARPPSSDTYLKSVLNHEFHHYKQQFARRGGAINPSDIRAGDRIEDAEIETLGLQIASAVNSDMSDKELESLLDYMALHLKGALPSVRDTAVDHIVATVKDDPEAQKRLLTIINGMKLEGEATIKPLKTKLEALAPPPEPKKGKKGKKGRSGK